MVLLISELAKIGVTKPIFLDSGSPRGGGYACVGMVCYHCIVHILNPRKKLYIFSLSLTAICAELCCQAT